MRSRSQLAGLAAAALVLPLAACGEGGGEEPLQFWNLLSGDDGRFMQQIVDDYNDTDPEIPVSFQPAPRDDMYMRMYSVARAGSDIPDVVLAHNLVIAELATNEILTPVEPLMSEQSELRQENYLDAAWEAGVYDGAQWGIPLDLHGLVTYYNVALVEELSLEHILDDGIVTVDELLELEDELPDDLYATTAWFMPGLIYNWQYNVGDGVGGAAEDIDFGGDSYVESFEAVKALQESGLMAPEDSDAAQVFRSGRSVFHPSGTWEISAQDEVEGLEWDLTHSMQLDAENAVNQFESHSFVQMADEDRDPERDRAVADFLEFVRTNSLHWAEAGQIVASRDTYDSDAYAEYPQSFFTQPENEGLLVTDNFEFAPYVGEALWDEAQNVTFGRYSIEQAVERMNSSTQARIEMVEAP
ncbi:extracellular solute-binding protein [Nesterenkonia sp. HG001]|uniref:extracellular solute-binding protein n=1 Tax=Nesterenkonia sp. HG001 TaxID=2983207 RepID=UPI002AC7BCB5|nr:extracellular solute-binding protein [Nesterenkonia sp. HG001]MDZ5076010.1 extracellular solute-binding protein [Nesterenkonia sp. HG001]